jgi:Trk-type K+ transport system membrane component
LEFKYLYRSAFLLSLAGIFAFISDFAFALSSENQRWVNGFYFLVLAIGLLSTGVRYYENKALFKRKVFIFDFITILYTLGVIFYHFYTRQYSNHQTVFYDDPWVKFAVVFTFFREFSDLNINYKRTVLNPAQLFIASFLSIIIIGALLLMTPMATYGGISFLDSLFTATSAVCVTGLIVVDTATYFTIFGQTIILVLIQVGGLGILTFASYFSYFFKGGTTYENQLVLGDLVNSKTVGDVFSILKYILLITFIIEFLAAILIYSSIGSSNFNSQREQIFFSVFHAVSAFCNAGFSTLTNNLYEEGFQFNYYLHLIIIATLVLGGIGFPIVVNILKYFKYKIIQLFSFSKKKMKYRAWVINMNSRITLVTTFALILVGFIGYYVLEQNNTLANHNGFGKIVTALFGATTPRTAGFNTVDMTLLSYPTVIMMLLLMWIGASPSSTGGGIKTSTFAVATLNILSLAKGKTRVEIFRREIADITIRRSFAIISLSLIVIGMGIMLISIFDEELSLKDIAFEVFSAFGTVGLSLGITAKLSSMSKIVLIVVMFIGRVNMLTLVIAIFKKEKRKNYRYPTEEIIIN